MKGYIKSVGLLVISIMIGLASVSSNNKIETNQYLQDNVNHFRNIEENQNTDFKENSLEETNEVSKSENNEEEVSVEKVIFPYQFRYI